MTNPQRRWDDWLTTLDEDECATAIALRDRFARLGADEPGEWARSEISEGIPQLARFLLLRRMWIDAIDGWERPGAVENIPAVRRLLGSGAGRADVVGAVRAAAFEAISTALCVIDEGCSPDLDDGSLPGWCLLETDGKGHHTGRRVGGLHESLAETDPSGRGAEDLWS